MKVCLHVLSSVCTKLSMLMRMLFPGFNEHRENYQIPRKGFSHNSIILTFCNYFTGWTVVNAEAESSALSEGEDYCSAHLSPLARSLRVARLFSLSAFPQVLDSLFAFQGSSSPLCSAAAIALKLHLHASHHSILFQ